MRRFEFKEGTSSKFWEVEVQGTALTVRFGKLGTSGQTKLKDFPTEEKATAEAEKLIREKTGKGYVETAGSNPKPTASPDASKPASPALPTPAPTPAAPAGDDEGEVVLPEEAKARLLTWRGGPNPAEVIEAGDPEKLFAQIRSALPKLVEQLRSQTRQPSPEAKRRFDQLADWSELEDLDVERAANSHVVLRRANSGRKTLIRFWLGARGPAFALEALATAMERDMVKGEHWRQFADGIMPFSTRDADAAHYARADSCKESLESAIALRTAIAAAAEPAYQQVLAAAPAVAAKGPLAAALVGFVLSEESALGTKAANDLLTMPVRKVWGYPGAELLLASVRDPALGARLAAFLPSVIGADSSCLWTCIARMGPGAGAVFAEYDAASPESNLMPYLQAIHTPRSFRALLPLLSVKKVARPLQKFLLDHPQVTYAAALSVAANSKDKSSAAAKILIGNLESTHPELAAASGGSSPIAAAPEASGAALPPVLANPPWLEKKAGASVSTLQINALERPITAAFRDGEREQWDALVPNPSDPRVPTSLEGWKSEVAADEQRSCIDFLVMHFAPEALALQLWNSASDSRRLYYPNGWYGQSILSAIVRRGPAFIPGLLKLVQLSAAGADRMRIDVIGKALASFDGSAIADTFLDKLDAKQLRPIAEAWALRYPETMAERAIPRAVAGGKPAANAISMLRTMILKGKGEAVAGVGAKYGQGTPAALDAVVGTDPTMYFPEKLPKLPEFFQPKLLPQLLLRDGGAVPAAAATHLGTMLAMSAPDAPYAGVALVRKACTPQSCRDFAWGLFEAWMAVGSPPKEMWALHALGFLGDDEVARRLTPLIRAWPGERAAARAVEALAVLANLGTDLALMLLAGIADKVRFASIQEGARERIEQIAEARGLTRDELADRLVPDLGLDPRGELELDFGPRRFRVGFDEKLELVVSDAEGKRLSALPKAGKSDDAAKAKEATETFKALKKDVAAIARSRIDRLQTAMITRRRWSPAEHRLLFLDKPLVLQLTRRLLWGAYDAGGGLVASFRVDLDRSFASPEDRSWTLPDDVTVGVVHPLELDDATRSRWGQVFGDYELLQPFDQLGRHLPCPKTSEVAGVLARLEELRLPAPKLVFGLEKQGWKRGAASDGGSFCMHYRVFAGTPFSAEVSYDGAVGMGYIEEKEQLSVREVTFFEGKTRVAAETVDLAIVNEVARELQALAPE